MRDVEPEERTVRYIGTTRSILSINSTELNETGSVFDAEWGDLDINHLHPGGLPAFAELSVRRER